MEQNLLIERILNVLNKNNQGEYYNSYAESEIYDSGKGIFVANWNDIKPSMADFIESEGFMLEWDDTTISCHACGNLINTNPTHAGWKPKYSIIDGCELYCESCMSDDWEPYIEELINDSDKVNVFDSLDLNDYGFKNMNGVFESGLHQYMNDSPEKILNEYMEKFPDYEFIFGELNNSQFYLDFKIFGRKKVEEEF